MRPLPANPSLDHLRQQARALQRAVRSGDPAAVERAAHQHPLGEPADRAEFPLSAALLVVAREYGFPSWSRLKRFVELAAGQAGEAGRRAADPLGEVADEFCRQACLTYTAEDDPERWDKACDLLTAQPRLTRSHIWAAAAAAQPGTVGRLLDEEPTLARLPGGPHGWSPLFYLAYSRVAFPPPNEMWLASARLLLEAGADPNESHPHPGLPYPLTVLTGVFGEAEDGTRRQPAHPFWTDLAGMLVFFGADACDPQVVRNRMFRPSSEYLRVLFRHGRPPRPHDRQPGDPAAPERIELWRGQLRYAVEHDLAERVSVLVEGGVDYWSAYPDGRTPLELAREHGSDGVARYLTDPDIPQPPLDELFKLDPALLGHGEDVTLLINSAYISDRATIERLVAERPDIVDRARQYNPGLIAELADLHSPAHMISLLAEIGFDVDSADTGTFVRQYMLMPALHLAVLRGDLDLARLMLSLGADPNLRDDAGRTPLDNARRAGQDRMVALLAPVTG